MKYSCPVSFIFIFYNGYAHKNKTKNGCIRKCIETKVNFSSDCFNLLYRLFPIHRLFWRIAYSWWHWNSIFVGGCWNATSNCNGTSAQTQRGKSRRHRRAHRFRVLFLYNKGMIQRSNEVIIVHWFTSIVAVRCILLCRSTNLLVFSLFYFCSIWMICDVPRSRSFCMGSFDIWYLI